MNEINKNNSIKTPLGWKVCPYCGAEIPKITELKFCTSCGIDLEYLKQYKRIPPDFLKKLNSSSNVSYEYHPQWNGFEQISDEEILDTEKKRLWSTLSSIGLAIAALVIMNFVAVFLMIPFIFFAPSMESLIDSFSSPYFLIITSFAELVFVLVPLIYIKKYLKNPNLKNRLTLLGFTTQGMNSWGVLKEIALGLFFSAIGILLVFIISFSIESILELFFGIEIIREVSITSGDIDMIILSSDLMGLILIMLVMIFVIGPSEEILFRGFMQKGLIRRLGKRRGLIITALIFTFIHLIGSFLLYDIFSLSFLVSFILSFFPYLALSFLLGLLYQWRKENLITVMIMHGFYNALTVLLAFLFYSLGF